MKYLKSFLLMSVLLMFSISSLVCARGKTPSVFDKPEEGLYYIIVTNQSSVTQEIQIYSIDDHKVIHRSIFLTPWPDCNSSFATHFKLGAYYLFVRIEGASLDDAKSIRFVLDEEYINNAPGPMILEISD